MIKFIEVISLRTKVTEIAALFMCFGDFLMHLIAVVPVKTIPFHDGRFKVFAQENMFDGRSYSAGTRT